MLTKPKARPRLYLDLSEAEKERFQRAVIALGSNMTAVIREFLPQWCEQQENANNTLPKFIVICLDEDLHHQASDKAKAETIQVSKILIEGLEKWVRGNK